MAKKRSRRGEPVPEAATVVVRGNLLDPEGLRDDTADNFEIYGFWGVSVFAAVGGHDLTWIASNKLLSAGMLVLFRAGDLFAAGLELWDTGQSPHYDVVHHDVDELVGRLVACQHRIIRNPVVGAGGPR